MIDFDAFNSKEKKEIIRNDLPAFKKIISRIRFVSPRRDIPEWAEEKRSLPPGTPFEGPWRNSRAPFWIEIMRECSSSSKVESITILKAGQIGATSNICENKIGNAIGDDPQGILYVTATTGLAREWSQLRIRPLLESCGLSKLISPIVMGNSSSRSRESGDTTLAKKFSNGAFVTFVSYNQEALLRTNSYRTVIFDEVDAAPIDPGVEGSARERAAIRTTMFEGQQKMIFCSTPLEKSTSRIWALFEEGDQSYCWLKCPHCGEWINMRLLNEAMKINLVFDFVDEEHKIVDSKTVGYPCPECNELIKTRHKQMMFDNEYKWIPTNTHHLPRVRSFFLDALYAAVGGVTFERLAQEWVSAQDDPRKLITYINLRGGLPFEDVAESVSDEQIYSKIGGYKCNTIPPGVILVTAGCDLHGDRLDVVIKGYNGKTCWYIGWKQYLGDPTMNDGGSLQQFAIDYANGNVPGSPVCVFIDNGYEPDQVAACAATHPNIFAIKGEDWINGGAVFSESIMRKNDGDAFVRVNTGLLKGYIMHSLRMEKIGSVYPEGFSHFPANMPKRFYDQLNSERRIKEFYPGTRRIKKWKWVEFHSMGNHTLDCSVYADAACHYQIWRLAEGLEVKEGYVEIIWECLRDPSKVERLAEAGLFS